MDRKGFNILLIIFYIVIGFLAYFLVVTAIEDYKDKHPKVSQTTEVEDIDEFDEEFEEEEDEEGRPSEDVKTSEEKARGYVDRILDKLSDFFSGRSQNDDEEDRDLNQKTFFEKYYDNVMDFFTGGKHKKKLQEQAEEQNEDYDTLEEEVE